MSKIGLGCVTFGREIDKETSFSLMDYAFEKGIRFWDTAAVYGNGASESIIGQWLKNNQSVQKEITISTKILPPYNEKSLQEILTQSLHRLNLEQVDILYLHNWHETAVIPPVLKKITDLIRYGLVRKFGLSNFNLDQLKKVSASCEHTGQEKPKYIQNNHNVSVSDLTPEMIRLCREHEIDIVTYSPLGAGFLTGKHVAGVAKGSRFDRMPAHQQVYFTEQSMNHLQILLDLSRQCGITSTELALSWAFNQPFVSKVLIGVRRKEHIDQALAAMHSTDARISGCLNELNFLIGGKY